MMEQQRKKSDETTEEVGVDGTDKTLSTIGSVDGKGTLRTAPVANEEFGADGTTFACPADKPA